MKDKCTEDDLFYLLHEIAHLLRTHFDQRARTWGMTRAQCVILTRLKKQPGITQSEMAGLCEVEPITVARLVDRLEAGGFLERRADPTDRRVHRLHLLPAAEPILDRLMQSREEAVLRLVGDTDPTELGTTVTVLQHIKTKLAADGANTRPQTSLGEKPV